MEIYKEYFKTKTEIAALQDKLDRLSSEIVTEIKDLSAPMRMDFGTFTTVVTKKYQYSDDVVLMEKEAADRLKALKGELFAPVEDAMKHEVSTGKAKVEESVGLRFTPNKD